MLEVAFQAGIKVVENANGLAGADQRLNEMGADETGAACYQGNLRHDGSQIHPPERKTGTGPRSY